MPLLLILIFFIAFTARADVYTFPDNDWHVSLGSEFQDFELGLQGGGGGTLTYNPNVSNLIVPRVAYKGLFALSWAFPTALTSAEKWEKGDTRVNNFRFDYTFHSFSVNAYYLQYSGMYLANSEEVDPSLAGFPKIHRADLYTRSLGVSMTWVWNHESFSLANLINQTERQERRGGSFLFGGSVSETNFKSDASLVPGSWQPQFDGIETIQDGNFLTLNTKVGYGYAWARKWFFGGAFLIGPGITKSRMGFDDGTYTTQWGPSARLEALAAGGYNGDQFFAVLRTETRRDMFFIVKSSSEVTSALISSGLVIGLHL